MNTHQYKKLKIWQDSVKFSIKIYKITDTFPKQEQFGLISQLRRASVSIPSNIAEGSKRGTKKDFISFLRISHGSSAEVETQLLIAKELNFIQEKDYLELDKFLSEITGMIASFIATINKS
jgi:four helix bundle protein